MKEVTALDYLVSHYSEILENEVGKVLDSRFAKNEFYERGGKQYALC